MFCSHTNQRVQLIMLYTVEQKLHSLV